jgi:predicted metal-dependent hydrolase
MLARSVADYFRPGFHPDDVDQSALVAEGLRRAGLTPG